MGSGQKVAWEPHDVLVSGCLCKERASLIQEPVQEDTRRHVYARELKQGMPREDNGRSKGDWGKQVWMVFWMGGRNRGTLGQKNEEKS